MITTLPNSRSLLIILEHDLLEIHKQVSIQIVEIRLIYRSLISKQTNSKNKLIYCSFLLCYHI